MLARPLVVELIDNQDAVLVTQFNKLATVGIVAGADVVHAELLHQLDALLDGPRIGGSTKCSEGVVIGIALQQHLLTIKFKSKRRAELYGADAERRTDLVHHGAVLLQQRDDSTIKIRMLAVPQLRILDVHLRQLGFHGARGRLAVLL